MPCRWCCVGCSLLHVCALWCRYFNLSGAHGLLATVNGPGVVAVYTLADLPPERGIRACANLAGLIPPGDSTRRHACNACHCTAAGTSIDGWSWTSPAGNHLGCNATLVAHSGSLRHFRQHSACSLRLCCMPRVCQVKRRFPRRT
jgi:hypothetical protein